MYTLPFSYSNSYLFQLNFSLVFHDEEVDRKVYTVCYHQEIINIDKTKKRDILEKGSILATHFYIEQQK